MHSSTTTLWSRLFYHNSLERTLIPQVFKVNFYHSSFEWTCTTTLWRGLLPQLFGALPQCHGLVFFQKLGILLVFNITIQCRLWSDAAFCGIWSRSALCASNPFTGLSGLKWVNAHFYLVVWCLHSCKRSFFIDPKPGTFKYSLVT